MTSTSKSAKQLKEAEAEEAIRREVREATEYNARKRGDKVAA